MEGVSLYGLLHDLEGSDRHHRVNAGLIELNSVADPCRLYSANGQHHAGFSLTFEQLAVMLDRFRAEADAPEMIYFCGSDPEGHPQLADFIELAREKSIMHIGLQCSGLRIAHDDGLLATLARLKPIIFIEFDGFDETSSLILHGRRDLPYETMRALDRLATAELPAALLTTVAKGVNLQEVGAVAAYGLKHPGVFGSIFRPVPPRESRLGASANDWITAVDIIRSLEQQRPGIFSQVDFAPAFCCRPSRHFITQVPLERQTQAGSITNGALATHSTAPTSPAENGQPATVEGAPCFWLGVLDFMTPWRYDLRRARRCPLVVIAPDGRTTPYCMFNAMCEDQASG